MQITAIHWFTYSSSRMPPHIYFWDCRGVTTYEGATLAARRVQNPVQAGTGDVHNPHTPLSRLPHRFCAGMQQ